VKRRFFYGKVSWSSQYSWIPRPRIPNPRPYYLCLNNNGTFFRISATSGPRLGLTARIAQPPWAYLNHLGPISGKPQLPCDHLNHHGPKVRLLQPPRDHFNGVGITSGLPQPSRAHLSHLVPISVKFVPFNHFESISVTSGLLH
jgi:hypothetical protein